MKAIFYKEIQSFLGNIMAYLLMIIFLLTNALLLWVFKGYSNIVYTGFANITPFFNNSAWIFIILIPALTMKGFTEEQNQGTLEILKTLPVSHFSIVFGKFLAYLLIIILLLLPTFIFVFSVYQLGNPVGNIDLGSTFSAYIGLVLLAATYIAIGLFSSLFSKNSITAFILSTTINSILYFGFSAIEKLSQTSTFGWNFLGVPQHFNNLNRGVVHLEDLIFFFSITFLFLGFTKLKLDND